MEHKSLTRWTKNGTVKSDPVIKHNDRLGEKYEEPDLHYRTERPIMVKGKQQLALPNLNALYDTLATPNGWRQCIDAYVTGSITTVANQAVNQAIKVIPNAQWKLTSWPGSVQLYPIFHMFSTAPQGAITTAGAISVVYIDQSGIAVPLGCFISNTGFGLTRDFIIPSPITDPNNVNWGSLQFTLTGSTPSVATYSYQLAFGAGYLLPAQKGYTIHEYDHWKEEILTHEKRSLDKSGD